MSRVFSYIALTKPRIIELLLVTTVPTMFVAAQGVPSIWLIAATVIGGTMAAGGANAFNMIIDRDIDRLMKRTQNRPMATGEIGVVPALIFASTLEVAAFFWLLAFANLLAAGLAVSATAFYVLVYSLWLKRSSEQNIVVGGAAGAVPVLVGWAAVTGGLGLAPVILFALIFFWTPPHFWALAINYKEDYAQANVPMMPVIRTIRWVSVRILFYTVLLLGFSLWFSPVADMGLIYLVSACVLGVVFLWFAVRLVQNSTREKAMRLFHYSITYVALLFTAIAVDQLVTL